MTLDPMLLLAADRQRELTAAARRRTLVRLARCCRPSTWSRALARAAEALHRPRAADCCA